MRLTEKEIMERFRSETDNYAPLTIARIEEQVSLAQGFRADAIIQFSIPNGPSFKALVEIKTVATPRTIREACTQLVASFNTISDSKLVPIIIASYIGKKQAEVLAEEGVSWIDLSGNMVVRVQDKIYIERTGTPNKFPDTSPIKKIFQGTSSLVSRALLMKPEGFESLYEIVNFVNSRNANITMSTVSKVLKSLEEELLITKSKTRISVMDAEKLLARLTRGYVDSLRRKERNTYVFSVDEINKLFTALYSNDVDYAACGFYAAKLKGLAVTDKIEVFVRDVQQTRKAFERELIDIRPDFEFGNVNIVETKDPCVWFNILDKPFEAIVDDIELYLEMMASTPRGPKIANKLKQGILIGRRDG